MNTVLAILLDIEGTTTSISFVHDVLFPYAKKHVGDYVRSHEAEVQDVLQQIREIVGDVDLDGAIAALQQWMEQDKKITPLKTLQGMMWEDGYKSGAFQGHLYKDAYDAMVSWKKQGIPLYIYSSGSVQAQKLLFRYSCYGDLTYLFSGHFDTKVGDKKEQSSYEKIAGEIGLPADSILFLSDVVEELDAAKKAGMQTTLLARGNLHTTVHSFEQIDLPSTPVDEIIRAGQFLDKMGLCPATGGNISVRAGELVAITVSGKDKGELTPQDVLYVDFSGKSFNGCRRINMHGICKT